MKEGPETGGAWWDKMGCSQGERLENSSRYDDNILRKTLQEEL